MIPPRDLAAAVAVSLALWVIIITAAFAVT